MSYLVILTADTTLKRIPSSQLIKFGTVTATGNAVLRREIDEVEILSANWTNDFSIPVCGKTHLLQPPSTQYVTGAPQTSIPRQCLHLHCIGGYGSCG